MITSDNILLSGFNIFMIESEDVWGIYQRHCYISGMVSLNIACTQKDIQDLPNTHFAQMLIFNWEMIKPGNGRVPSRLSMKMSRLIFQGDMKIHA